MRFVSGYIADVDEALALVLREAGRDDMSQEAIELFLSSVDSAGLQIPGEKVVDTEVRRRYGLTPAGRASCGSCHYRNCDTKRCRYRCSCLLSSHIWQLD